MRIGVILPTFRHGAEDAFAAARAAERAGLDGIFAYDHLWPMGRPDRPSLAPFPLLAALSQRVERVTVAPLVARVGLVPTTVLVEEFLTLESLAPGRVLAPLGTGDKLSAEENAAYGLAFPPAEDRRNLLEDAVVMLQPAMTVWIGSGGPATNAIAQRHRCELNLWGRSPSDVAMAATTSTVNWAGDARGDLEIQLDELAAAGATWAVFSPASDVTRLGAWREAHGAAK